MVGNHDRNELIELLITIIRANASDYNERRGENNEKR